MLDGVRERLLGDPEDRQLDVGRRPGVVGPLEADLAAGEPLDPEDEPVERRPDAEVVEDRQPEVAADRPEPVGDGPADLRALLSPDASSRRTSSVSSWSASSWMSAASRARSASVAATTRSRWSWARRREPGQRPDREPAGDAIATRARCSERPE